MSNGLVQFFKNEYRNEYEIMMKRDGELNIDRIYKIMNIEKKPSFLKRAFQAMVRARELGTINDIVRKGYVRDRGHVEALMERRKALSTP